MSRQCQGDAAVILFKELGVVRSHFFPTTTTASKGAAATAKFLATNGVAFKAKIIDVPAIEKVSSHDRVRISKKQASVQWKWVVTYS